MKTEAGEQSALADDEEGLIKRAYAAYFRRFGPRADQASHGGSHVEDGFVVLENVNGELAQFKICRQRLRFVESES